MMRLRHWVALGIWQVIAFGSTFAQENMKSATSTSLLKGSSTSNAPLPPTEYLGISGDEEESVGFGGTLDCQADVLSQNTYGGWNQVGAIDTCEPFEAIWNQIGIQITDRIHEKLAEASKDRFGPDFRGFEDIQLQVSPVESARQRVYIWPDKHKMRLTWILPDCFITCRADINNWFDRDVEISTDIHLEADIQLTGESDKPAVVVLSFIHFRNTQVCNDGDCGEDSLNHDTEMEFNNALVEISPIFIDSFFRNLSNTLAQNITPTTYALQFDYDAAESRLICRILNRGKSQPTIDLQPVTSTMQSIQP